MKKISPLVLTAAAVAAVALLSACATEKVTRSTTTETTYETGYTINSLPSGYTTYSDSGNDYYVIGENYFRRTPSGYTVVETPSGVVRSTPGAAYSPGYVTRTLPAGYTTYTNAGNDYYVVGDNYFRRTPSGYTVVESPSGVVRSTPGSSAYNPGYVTRTLPAGYTTRSYRGADYYIANGNYYRRDKRGYVVVEAPM